MNFGNHGHGRNISRLKLAICAIVLLAMLSPIVYSLSKNIMVPHNISKDSLIITAIIIVTAVFLWLLYKIMTKGYTPKVDDEYKRILGDQGWKKVIDHIEGSADKESDDDLR